jgi:hypothetical protein
LKTATIWVQDGELKLRMPYDVAAIEAFKRTFCAEWRWYDRKTKVWSLIITKQFALETFCRLHFAKVVFLGDMPSMRQEPVFAEELAAIIGEIDAPLLDKLYKLLIFELHPDRGGDEDLCRRVLVAYETWKGQD